MSREAFRPLSTARSEALLDRARHLFPGGVNNPARAFRAVADVPRFVARAEGAFLVDVDHNRYVDLMMSRGPLILGHADPRVTEAIMRAVQQGASFDTPSEVEVLLGERVVQWVPSVEKLRFTLSSAEAVMGAMRAARAFTGRAGILKMEGHHHGDVDAMQRMSTPASGGNGLAEPAGVPEGALRDTWAAPFNDVEALRLFFQRHPGQIAAVILEPVASGMGVIAPRVGYLQAVRDLARSHGALVIFDEVTTGFRLERGGAQEFYGVQPDLTVLGKILGGGLPGAALGGRADVMNLFAPQGPVMQTGLFAGNPPAMAAGLAVLDALQDERAYAQLEAKGIQLEAGLVRAASEAGVPVQIQRVGSMLTLFFHDQPVRNWADASRCDTRRYAAFARALYARGVYAPPGQYEAMYLSLAHGASELERVIDAGYAAMREAAAA